jgi:cytochrome bd ubiquinol oxidase subunit II
MLNALPLVFVLIGLVLYTVLAGADFGAGMWQLMSGGGERGERIRDHCHRSMGPVWEANHVWLIFVLTVTWTAYPVFFGSVASTLAAALFIAALGIILRGASYALRSGAAGTGEVLTVDRIFAVASLVTPFALGAAAGAIAAERVPVGNAAGNAITSWLNPTSILVGLLAPWPAAWRLPGSSSSTPTTTRFTKVSSTAARWRSSSCRSW